MKPDPSIPPTSPPFFFFSNPRHLPSCFGTSAGRRRLRAGAGSVVCPFVQAAAAGVHEEVAYGGEFEAQLLGDGELHLLGRPLVLLEDGQQGAPLQVREDQPRLLWCVVAILRRVLLLPFARCQVEKRKQSRALESGRGPEDVDLIGPAEAHSRVQTEQLGFGPQMASTLRFTDIELKRLLPAESHAGKHPTEQNLSGPVLAHTMH